MSPISFDAKAVVKAVDALTTQVQRLADAQQTPVVRVGDGVTTTADDGASCPGYETTPNTCRCGCEGCRHNCAAHHQAPAADEDAQRTARRQSAHNLLARLDRGGLLSPGDCALLRQHFDAETREHDTARSVAAGNKRHVQTIVPEIDRLAAKLEDAEKRAEAASRVGTRHMVAAEQAEDLLRVAHETSNRSEAERTSAVQRADTAETELRTLRTGLRANGADPTQIQNLWAQIRLRNRQWRDAKRERDEAQAAIERVRAVLDDPSALDWRQRLRAALDGTEQPTTEA